MNLIYSIIKAQNDARKNGYEGPYSCTLTAEQYRQFTEETKELRLFYTEPLYTGQFVPGKFYAGKVFDVSIYVEQSQTLKESLILEQYEKQLRQ